MGLVVVGLGVVSTLSLGQNLWGKNVLGQNDGNPVIEFKMQIIRLF